MERNGNMRYCDNCGAKIDGRKKFCDSCGATIREAKYKDYIKYDEEDETLPYQPTPPPLPKQSFILLIIGFFIPGLGQIFFDKNKRAAMFFSGLIVLFLIGSLLRGLDYYTWSKTVFWMFIPYSVLVNIDTIQLYIRYNRFVKKNYRSPEDSDKW